jgi:hypothetical protein
MSLGIITINIVTAFKIKLTGTVIRTVNVCRSLCEKLRGEREMGRGDVVKLLIKYFLKCNK